MVTGKQDAEKVSRLAMKKVSAPTRSVSVMRVEKELRNPYLWRQTNE